MGAGCISNKNSTKLNSRKCSFKPPDKQKRLKTEPETENSKTEESNFENKKNLQRRSKRKKIQNSNKETVGSTSSDRPNVLKNGMKIAEDDKLPKGCSVNLISDTIMKSLDKTLFNDDSDKSCDLNDMSKNDLASGSMKEISEFQVSNTNENSQQILLICTTSMSSEVPVSPSIQEINKFEVAKVNEYNAEQISPTEKSLNDDETLPNKLKSNLKQNLQNRSQTFSMVNSDEGVIAKEAHTMEAKVDGKSCEKEKIDKITLNTENEENCETVVTVSKFQNFEIESKTHMQSKMNITGEQEENDTTKNVNNKNGVKRTNNVSILNVTNLDQLYVGIKKADAIINELAYMVDGTENCAERGNTTCTTFPKVHSSFNHECRNENSCKEYRTNTSEKDPKMYDNLRNELFEPDSVIFSNCQELSNNFQKNIVQNKNQCIVEKTEENIETEENYSNSGLGKNDIEAKSTILYNMDIHHMKTNSVPERQVDETKGSALDQINLTEQADYAPIFKSEKEICLLENIKHSHKTITPDKSAIKGKPTEIFQVCLNEDEHFTHTGNEAKTNISLENLELKQRKLTLLYMNALDYAKENKEHDKEILSENKDAHDDNKNNSYTYIYTGEENVEINKNDLDNKFNSSDEQKLNIKTNLLLRGHEDINVEREVSEEKENNGYTQQKSLAISNAVNTSQEIRGFHAFETTDDQLQTKEIKDNFSDSKESSESYDIQTLTALQIDDKNTSVSRLSNNELMPDNELNNTGELKNEEIDRCYRKLASIEPFLVTATDCLKSEPKQSSIENKNESIEEKDVRNSEEEGISPHSDVEESFDMDDDFDLTSSQIHMIDINENNHFKESSEAMINSYQQTEDCSNTHFALDSVTVEIIEQLCYIRESVESIKKTLNILSRTNEGHEKNA